MKAITCFDADGRSVHSLTQWDKNQVVYVDNIYGITPEAHFALRTDKKESYIYKDATLSVDDKIKIIIPNDMLCTSTTLQIFLYYKISSSETTKFVIMLPIRKKNKPTGYVYTENLQQKTAMEIVDEIDLMNADFAKKSIYDDYAISLGRREETVKGTYSGAVGLNTEALGHSSFAMGERTTAMGAYSHIEGYSENNATQLIDLNFSTANDDIANAWKENKFSLAKSSGAHVEGSNNLGLGNYCHAEGSLNILIGNYSHIEGYLNSLNGNYSHVEGINNTVEGKYSHVEGALNDAIGDYIHVSGFCNRSNYNNQFVLGKFNDNKVTNIFEIGNGSSNTDRCNVFEVNTYGNGTFKGDVISNNKNLTKLENKYAICTTPASSSVKYVTKEGFVLEEGAEIIIKFANENTYPANPSLNVNGTGARPMSSLSGGMRPGDLLANGVYRFVYDGNAYILMGIYPLATEFRDGMMSKNDKKKLYGSRYGVCDSSVDERVKIVTIDNFTLENGAEVFIKFKNTNTYVGSVAININDSGEILARGSNGNVISANDSDGTFQNLKSGRVYHFVYDSEDNYYYLI